MAKVPLEDQIDSLETTCDNLKEAIDILKKIAVKQNRLNPQILHEEKRLEELCAALNSLIWLRKNKETVLRVYRDMGV